MPRVTASMIVLLSFVAAAAAQDIPGIENCSAEKAMDRRTGCLQSNVNYLYQQLTKANAEARQKVDAASRRLEAANAEIAALRGIVTKLQASVDELQAAAKKNVDPKK